MTSPTTLIVDAVRAGVLLIPQGERLTYKALDRVPGELAQRLRTHKADVLAVLRGEVLAEPTSVSEPQQGLQHGRGGWSEDELATLARAGKTPADLPLVAAVKDAFAPAGGVTVTSIQPTSERQAEPPAQPTRPPDPVAALPVLADIARRGWACWRDGSDLCVNRRQDPPDEALA